MGATGLAAQFEAGGIYMWFILACSAIGVAITIERYLTLSKAAKVRKDELLNHVNSYILQGKLDRAISVTSQVRSPLTNIIRAGLVSVANNGSNEEVQTAMDAIALKEIPYLEKRIGLLATIANLATLLGLLGTVSGLIDAFAAVTSASPAEKAVKLADAISVSMNTTAFGLIVAIPILASFGYLNSLAQEMIDDIHESSVSVLNFVLTHKEKIRSA